MDEHVRELDLHERKQETTDGDHIDTAPDNTAESELAEDILEQYRLLEAGEKQETVSVWDQDIAALLFALDAPEEKHQHHLDAIAEALGDELDCPVSAGADRSEVIRLALRVGLQEAPDHIREAHRTAAQEHRDPGI